MDEFSAKIASVFFPSITRELASARDRELQFSHYTSAESGMKILQTGKILLRNSSLMNDFSEVSHGMDCLLNAYYGQKGEVLKKILNGVQSDLSSIIDETFQSELSELMSETYLFSISEHNQQVHEKKYGRLSMWRAYAPKDGVAFILNKTPFLCESTALNAYSTRVVYATPDDFQTAFAEVVSSIGSNFDFVKALGGQAVHNLLISAFRFAVQSTKHPSFKEEDEWRVLYSPARLNTLDKQPHAIAQRVPTEVLSLRGVPQQVYAIPFCNYPEEGFVGATIPEIISEVLVGPSQDSHAIRAAYIIELSRLGVADAANKVKITGIPLRH